MKKLRVVFIDIHEGKKGKKEKKGKEMTWKRTSSRISRLHFRHHSIADNDSFFVTIQQKPFFAQKSNTSH